MTQTELSTTEPTDIIKQALASHDNLQISFSGAEDIVLIDLACNLGENFEVFSLDTGRLHPETYRFIEEVRNYYGLDINVISPDGEAVAELVKRKGLYSFYEDGHQECCGVRKIEPLRRHLQTADAWMTGQRQDQSPTRNNVPHVQVDTAFSDTDHEVMKYNPLSEWRSIDVWNYIRENNLPYNKLHDQGYQSIGCEPCTRPIGPNQHERAGRWWWEEATKKECGLHMINVTEQ